MAVHLKTYKGKSVFVGLSGGVDSAVSAALLQKAGAIVTGVFIQGYYPPEMPCTWRQDRKAAMSVAAHLRIPFVTLDASEEYKTSVIDYLVAEYRKGRTPNGDIFCNRDVKFGAFYRYAMAHGADYIATGHYAKNEDGRLFRGADETKDQSYFLWAIRAEVLASVIFPIGGMQKSHVRTLAKKLTLPNAGKRDSQGICFLGSVSVLDFLQREIGSFCGLAYLVDGEVVGTHRGAVLYTIGERVALTGAFGGPWYVVEKDMQKNVLTVSRQSGSTTKEKTSIELLSLNLLSPLRDTSLITAQYRYHGSKIQGYFNVATKSFISNAPLPGDIAPGQSLVIYSGEECIGGGIIA